MEKDFCYFHRTLKFTKADELRRMPPACASAPRFRWTMTWDPELKKVEANEGSLASTTMLLTRLRDPGVSKWDTASLMFRAESGSREMGGISKTSSPRLGV